MCTQGHALIAERCEHKGLAIAANTPRPRWGEAVAEPAMTLAAVVWRRSTILQPKVERYRLRAAPVFGVEKNSPAASAHGLLRPGAETQIVQRAQPLFVHPG